MKRLLLIVVLLLVAVTSAQAQESFDPNAFLEVALLDDDGEVVARTSGSYFYSVPEAEYMAFPAGETPDFMLVNGDGVHRIAATELEEPVCIAVDEIDYRDLGDEMPAPNMLMTLAEAAFEAVHQSNWQWLNAANTAEVKELSDIAVDCPDGFDANSFTAQLEMPLIVVYYSQNSRALAMTEASYATVPPLADKYRARVRQGMRFVEIVGSEYNADSLDSSDSGTWTTCRNVGQNVVTVDLFSDAVMVPVLNPQLSAVPGAPQASEEASCPTAFPTFPLGG